MASKSAYKQLEYPLNLMTTVFGSKCDATEYYDIGTIGRVVQSFDEREREIIRLRYMMKSTYAQIAEHLGISPAHVMHLDQRCCYYIRVRYACYLVDERVGIERLGLATRYVTVLKKNGINSIYDLIGYDKDSLLAIKGIGEVCLSEITYALDQQGISTHRFK